jgi:ankyrin repeat protein
MRTAVALGFGQEEDSLEALTMLLDLGLDVNATDAQGFTAMHGAAERGANSIVRFLFEHGARLDPASKPSVQTRPVDNEPPLHIPSLTPIDSALDSDPPRPATVALIRELMGQDPNAAMRPSAKKR